MSVIVTLPVLLTSNEYVISSPAAAALGGSADLTSVRAGWRSIGTSRVDVGGVSGGALSGGEPLAVAVLVSVPASASAWVTV